MANFDGNLFYLCGAPFPLKYIFKNSYSVTPHNMDLDSTQDTTGILQRNVLEATSVTISITTKPMYIDDFTAMWAFIRSKLNNMRERKVNVTWYNPETDVYETDTCYSPDVEHNMDMVDSSKRSILYMSETIEFIGYGKKDTK